METLKTSSLYCETHIVFCYIWPWEIKPVFCSLCIRIAPVMSAVWGHTEPLLSYRVMLFLKMLGQDS